MKIPERNYTQREATACGLLASMPNVTRLLNVGQRPFESTPWWVSVCKHNGVTPVTLEVWRPYCEKLKGVKVIEADVCDYAHESSDEWDVILWWHGPEHVEKIKAESTILRLLPRCGQLIVGTPWGDHPQGEVAGNPYERHASTWEPDDYRALGLHATGLADREPGHITAWKGGYSP